MGKSLKGKNLGKGFTQRKDGLYQATYYDENGKRKYMYDTNLRRLRQNITIRKDEIENGRFDEDMTLKTGFSHMPTFDDVWHEFYSNRLFNMGLKETTIRYNYIRTYDFIYEHDRKFTEIPISQFTKAYCEKYLNRFREEHGYTAMHLRTVMKCVFDYAMDCDIIERNPMTRVTVRTEPKEKDIITYEDERKLLEAETNEMYRRLMIVDLQTGLRRGEILGLQWGDIDFDKRMIHVTRQLKYCQTTSDSRMEFRWDTPKTRKSVRKIPLTDKCMNALKEQYEYRRVHKAKDKEFDDLVFLSPHGVPIEGCAASSHYHYLSRKAGVKVKSLTLHVFRHTFASRLNEKGVNPKVIQELMGHSSIQMTMNVYTHVTDDNLSSEMKKLEI